LDISSIELASSFLDNFDIWSKGEIGIEFAPHDIIFLLIRIAFDFHLHVGHFARTSVSAIFVEDC